MAIFNSDNKNMLLAIIAFVVVIVTCIFSYSLFSKSSIDSYKPIAGDGKGFIGKADALFADLLSIENIDTKKNLTPLEQLNYRYPALIFALPDDVNAGECLVGDIRLVGIKENRIKDTDLKNFYLSSELQNILRQQKQNLYKKYFNLKIKISDGVAEIEYIKMIPELYTIKFNNKPWLGTIVGQSYGKIDSTNSLFVVYGSSVLPVKRQDSIFVQRQENYIVQLKDNYLQHSDLPVDLYDYYKECYENGKFIRFSVDGDDNKSFTLQILTDTIKQRDSLVFDMPTNLDIYCGTNKVEGTTNASRSRGGCTFGFNENVIKVVVSDKDIKNIKAELYLFRKNPMNTLSYSLETNKGKIRTQVDTLYTDNFTQKIVDVFNQKMNETSPDSINLSIDPYLSKTLEGELKKYVDSVLISGVKLREGEKVEISISLINSATGEILAAPSYSTLRINPAYQSERKNSNTQRRFIGSCFKPLMTLAAVQIYPDLLIKRTNPAMWHPQPVAHGDRWNVTLLGCPISDLSNGITIKWCDNMDMKTYFATSNDVYPIMLAMYAFTNPNRRNELPTSFPTINPHDFPATLLLPKGTDTEINSEGEYPIHNNQFATILDILYAINSTYANQNTQDMNMVPENYAWRMFNNNISCKEDSISFPDISPESTNMNYWSWYKKGETFRTKVISWVLGQGDNSWSPLKLAEAWARMNTKYPVRLSFIRNHNPTYEQLLTKQIELDGKEYRYTTRTANAVWNDFLQIFRDAQSLKCINPLLSPAHSRVTALGRNLVILGKTGTPDEFSLPDIANPQLNRQDVVYDMGLYAFSLMTTTQFNRIRNANENDRVAHNSGISVVVRIVHTCWQKENGEKDSALGNKINSSSARNFISNKNNVLEKILFYTDKLFQ